MANGSFTLETEHGIICITDTALKSDLPALLLIHGNSSSSKIWRHILESEAVNTKYRIIAFDLPGHGASSNAPDPDKTYSMRGYADLAVHILQHLSVEEVVVFGWSLGGHIGIEMVPLLAQTPISMKGLMITGTPPALGIGQTSKGFLFEDVHMGMAARKDLTEDDIISFTRGVAGEAKYEDWMEADVRRCDGRSRFLMWKKFGEGVGVNQVKVVEETDVLIAVVNGGAEPFVNLDYLDAIKWGNLWEGKCLRIPDEGHAPFWEGPEEFEKVLLKFLADASK
ncbi:Alpha/Beta hydrolase protein [Lophiotrema nucula]|uniref:Alpha/Beta hydrolase protein n=1 Tax=Lophiotrema nucula TaxID=690887 RepID=A0A6A5YUQ7_9PLEO|nr:Alpha/Beta hydrolase protein [Lophiotrema nucula]